jgi:hypothetical protein
MHNDLNFPKISNLVSLNHLFDVLSEFKSDNSLPFSVFEQQTGKTCNWDFWETEGFRTFRKRTLRLLRAHYSKKRDKQLFRPDCQKLAIGNTFWTSQNQDWKWSERLLSISYKTKKT